MDDDLDVAALDVLQPGTLERPARLLAEVADRDRDEHAVVGAWHRYPAALRSMTSS